VLPEFEPLPVVGVPLDPLPELPVPDPDVPVPVRGVVVLPVPVRPPGRVAGDDGTDVPFPPG
jgi:hypothetical protein